MTSPQTDAILEGVQERLYNCVFNGHNLDMTGIKRVIAICRIHYDAWDRSYKFEANNAQYAYTNLPEETKQMDAQVKWYFKLLDALVKASE
jgi:hypothetical protein